ncbi:MAG: hypothetical protein E4H14_13975 [Candidatus Thorarchaeota archaeon]|nr:MAG: hypothetical protein E4H14_13975 [Candidatus Thorarchaeota archaeon]
MNHDPVERFLSLASKLDDVYKTMRIKSLCVRNQGSWMSIGTQITLLPYEVEEIVSKPYPGKYLTGFESYSKYISAHHLINQIQSGFLKLGKDEIILQEHDPISDWFFFPSSKNEEVDGQSYSYHGLILRGYCNPFTQRNLLDEMKLNADVRLNSKIRFDTVQELSKSYLGREIHVRSASRIYIEALSWTQIQQALFTGNQIHLTFTCPETLEPRIKIRAGFLLPDNDIRIHSLRLKNPIRKQLDNDLVEIEKTVQIPSWAQKSESVNITISVEDDFPLDNILVPNIGELNPTLHLMKSFDTAELSGRTFNKWIRSEDTSVGRKLDRFEYAISVLFISLGFVVVLPGPLGLEGIDVIAYLPDKRMALVLECSSGKVAKKAAGCLRAVKRLTKSISGTHFIGIAVTSGIASNIERTQLETDELKVIDSRDLDSLLALAEEKQNPYHVLTSLGIDY